MRGERWGLHHPEGDAEERRARHARERLGVDDEGEAGAALRHLRRSRAIEPTGVATGEARGRREGEDMGRERLCTVRGWTTEQGEATRVCPGGRTTVECEAMRVCREGSTTQQRGARERTSSTGRPVRCDMYPRIEKTTTPARKDVAQLISGTSLQ